jgi:cytochrome c553
MIKKILIVVISGWLAAAGNAQAAGDAAAGKAKAVATCKSCHGEKGEAVAKNPKLAGKTEADMFKAMKDYKSGAKPNPIMKTMMAKLSDQEMENLAAYYAQFK